ncbi:hypothetical protein [Sphingomonas lacunae]|nr:hypothetical protein [Sphingomonas lacunae]
MTRLSTTAAMAAAAFAFIAVASPAAAQNAGLTANSGEITLNAGFTPDPYRVSLVSGGSIDGGALPGACVGMISDAPDFEVTYSGGSLPLTFRTQSSGDTTLIINGPDGNWYCDDDSGGGVNARVTFRNARAGTYDIWVGAIGGSAATTLLISELP